MSNRMLLRRRAPLVGRASEMAALADVLSATAGGRLLAVMLSGEPGIGKTRLLEELPLPEAAPATIVLRGGAVQANGMPAYLPLVSALDEYVAAASAAHLAEDIGPWAPVLDGLLPHVRIRLPRARRAHALSPEQQRLRLFEAVTALVAAIAARTPGGLLLALDDLQWADASTCELLVHLARRLPHARLLLLGAYRDGEGDENAALMRALTELNRMRVLTRLPLRRLDSPASAALAAGLLGGALSADAAALIHRHAEGNPFFEEELLTALLGDGSLRRSGMRWEIASEPARLLPAGIASAVRVRVERLPPDTLEALEVASVVGRVFATGLVAAVLGADALDVEARLRPASGAWLVRPDAEGGYAFTHDKVRETVLAGMGAVRRTRAHAAVGAALEREPQERRPASDLAFHFAQAGDRERAVRYALEAAAEAERTAAFAQAAAHCRSAARLLEGSPDAASLAQVLVRLGDASGRAGSYTTAVESYRSAIDLIEELGSPPQAAEAWHLLGIALWRQEAIEDARAALERALALAPGDGALTARVLIDLGELLAAGFSRPLLGLPLLERAVATAERLADGGLQAAAYRAAGNLRARLSELETGRSLLERAFVLASELGELGEAAEAAASLANVRLWSGDLRSAEEAQRARERFARETQDPYQLRHVSTWLAALHSHRGEWRESEGLLRQVEPALVRLDSPEPLAYMRAVRAGQRYRRGRFAEAERDYRRAIEALRRRGSGTYVWYLASHGLALAELGRLEEAERRRCELDQVVDTLDEPSVVRGFALAGLVLLSVRLGAFEAAASRYPEMPTQRCRFNLTIFARALALAAACAGRLDESRAAFDEAEALARREGLLPELSLTLIGRGLVERQAVPAHAVRKVGAAALADGLRLADELGMGLLARRLLDAPPLPRRRRRSARSGPPDELTERERAVLRLVSQGRTNRDIAARLLLSEKTVANSLTTIFAKLGAANRATAAVKAHERGLG
jgi:predicted ATPase/DNA-binding CsgD family transcriptional regulator